jgi:hypothetical protein
VHFTVTYVLSFEELSFQRAASGRWPAELDCSPHSQTRLYSIYMTVLETGSPAGLVARGGRTVPYLSVR